MSEADGGQHLWQTVSVCLFWYRHVQCNVGVLCLFRKTSLWQYSPEWKQQPIACNLPHCEYCIVHLRPGLTLHAYQWSRMQQIWFPVDEIKLHLCYVPKLWMEKTYTILFFFIFPNFNMIWRAIVHDRSFLKGSPCCYKPVLFNALWNISVSVLHIRTNSTLCFIINNPVLSCP